MNKKLKSGLSKNEQSFASAYLNNGFNGSDAIKKAGIKTNYPEKVAFAYMQRPHVKNFIDARMQDVQQKLEKDYGITFDWKVRKLKQIIDCFLPDNGGEQLLNPKEAKAVISAIAELNKMQGDLAPDKHQIVNFDAVALLKLIHEYKKEF